MTPEIPLKRPSGPRFYRPELDALRFVAFLLVFLRHIDLHVNPVATAFMLSGQAGVCLFFVLSSYLITELLDREWDRSRTIDLKAFYIRRVLRIWPLYFFALALARLIDLHGTQMTNGRMAAFLLLAGNWNVYFHGLPASFDVVLWSVSVEEQFYLVWPFIRKFLGSRALLIFSLLTFPIAYGTIAWLAATGHKDLQFWVNTFVQIQFFGLGGLLALRLRGASPQLPMALRATLALGGLFAYFASQYWVHNPTEIPTIGSAVTEYLLMAAGTIMLFFAVLGLASLGRFKWLIYLGKISYGLYVFQFIGIRVALRPANILAAHTHLSTTTVSFFQNGLALVLTFVMAHLSYRYLESFFLRLKERFVTVKTREV